MPSTLEPPVNHADPSALALEQREWQALVLRITSSEAFARASQLREILTYVVQRSMQDTYPIKERDIAIEVLKRHANFDGTLDNIVRVQVGHLRRKLDQYFATEGKDERLLLVIPRGSYIPHFEIREPAHEAVVATEPLATPLSLPEVSSASANRPWLLWAAFAATAVLIVAAIVWQMGRSSHLSAVAAKLPVTTPANPMLARLFSSDSPVSVVTADANLQLIEDILHREVSISEYSSPNYPENLLTPQSSAELRNLIKVISLRRHTSYGDAAIVLQSSDLARSFGHAIEPRYARFINMRDLGQGNFILVGRSPWLALFQTKLNFVPEEDPKTHGLFVRNRNPLPGEPAIFPVVGNWSTESVSYAPLALVPNLSQTGYVLLLDGTGMEATEAGIAFLSRPDSADKLKKMLAKQPLDEHAPIEVLLRVHSVQGTANDFEIAAVRSTSK